MKNIDNSQEKKDIRSKYICMSSDDVYFYDDEDNIVTLTNYFNENNIQDNKIIFFKVLSLSKCEEVITDLKFDVTGIGYLIEKINSNSVLGNSNYPKTIEMDENDKDKYDNNYYESNRLGICFDGHVQHADYKRLLVFLNILKKNNQLDNYLKSVISFVSDGEFYTSKRKINQRLSSQKYLLSTSY